MKTTNSISWRCVSKDFALIALWASASCVVWHVLAEQTTPVAYSHKAAVPAVVDPGQTDAVEEMQFVELPD